MSYPRVLALVLAGGEGRRLRPLTADRPKPAAPLGRGCRIVDFALANLANSGVPWIYLLAQYKPIQARSGRIEGFQEKPAQPPCMPEDPHRAYAYDFATDRVPGLKAHEEAAYWRDVGTLEALAGARRDIEGPQPRLELDNPQWPLCPGAGAPEAEIDVLMRAELGAAKPARPQAGSPGG